MPDAHPEAGQALRAFFAVALPEAARAAAAATARRLRDGPGGDDVRWVRAENLHVTLRFLGDVPAAAVPRLLEHVGRRARAVAPFTLELHEPRVFPSQRRPRVVALAVRPLEPLADLAAAVERGVVEAGFAPEARRFRAHLTLGRVRRGARPQLDLGPRARGAGADDAPETGVTAPDTAPPEAVPVTEVVLYRSELRRGGSRYTPLGRVPLGAPASDITPEPSN